jgi:hypothetical protein
MTLIDPIGLPIVFFMGWRIGRGKECLFLDVGFQGPGRGIMAPGSKRAGKSMERPGPDWAPIGRSGSTFSTNSAKCSTIVLGYSRFEAGLAIGSIFAAENDIK